MQVVRLLGDAGDLAQFAPPPNGRALHMTAVVDGANVTMRIGGRLGTRDMAVAMAMVTEAAAAAEAESQRAIEKVADAYMRALDVADEGGKKENLIAWLRLAATGARVDAVVLANMGSMTIAVIPRFALRVAQKNQSEQATLTIDSPALPARVVVELVAPTLREVLRAFSAVTGIGYGAGDALSLLTQYDFGGLCYERDGDGEWVDTQHRPVADKSLLTRGGRPIKQREVTVAPCDPCLCGRPIFPCVEPSCVTRESDRGTVPAVKLCHACSTSAFACGAAAKLNGTHPSAAAAAAALTPVTMGRPAVKEWRLWGSLVLKQDTSTHRLVPVAALPSARGYMYCGTDRATPWQRMAYIWRWARSILARRGGVGRSSAIVGHIDRLADHTVAMILRHLTDSIRGPMG